MIPTMFRYLTTIFLLFFLPNISYAAQPQITAKSAVVIEASTGKILYAKNAEEKRYPASTTKIMTLIVALEHGNLNDVVTVSANAASTEGSSLWLTQGEKMTLHDLLYGIMLISGNDATVAVAEHISGSVGNFAKLMTEKAHAIGATNTVFTNSSGLPDPNHVTTAYDMAKITAYGYRNSLFTQIVSTKHKIIPWPGKEYDRDLYNENKMLWLYEGGNGVKTGYTEAAGRCLVSGAKREGIQLITVVFDSDHMWEDSIMLMDYGFSQVRAVKLFDQGEILKTVRILDGKSDTVKLVTGSSVIVPVSGNDKSDFDTVIDAPAKIEAPVYQGQTIGKMRIMYKGTEIAAVDLIAAETVEKKSFFKILLNSMWSLFTTIVRFFV